MTGGAFEAQSRDGSFVDLNLTNRLTYRTAQKGWTTGDVKRLTYLWSIGCTSGEIAELMGRTRSAICAAARRHDLPRRDCPIGTKPDLIRLREMELGKRAAIQELLKAA